jgi:hypothetical protein
MVTDTVVEEVSTVEQPPNKGRVRRNAVPILTALGILVACVVAGIAAKNSWGHIVEVGRSVGEPGANLLPVSVDGMMLAGTVMGAVDRIRGYKTRFWAVVALWLGSMMTLIFNVASAYERGLKAMGVAVIPAVTLIISVEAIFHPSRRLLETTKETISKVAAAAETVKIVESITKTKPGQTPAAGVAPVTRPEPPAGAKFKGRRPAKAQPGNRAGQQPKPKPVQQPQPARKPVTAALVPLSDEALSLAVEDAEIITA